MAASALLWAASAAVRAASLNLCADEYLLLLARPQEIASLSYLSSEPLESPYWRAARAHPRNGGSLESAVSARPSLVLTMGGGGRGTGLIARRLGIRVLDLPTPAGIADVVDNARRVAKALGDPDRAPVLQRRIEELVRTSPQRGDDAVFLSGSGRSMAADGLGADWLRLAGFRQRALPGNRMSLEIMTTQPPKWLIINNYRSTQFSRGTIWLTHPLVRLAPSQRLVADGRRWTCQGPAMIDEVERLRRHG